jgi:hypothetical protein
VTAAEAGMHSFYTATEHTATSNSHAEAAVRVKSSSVSRLKMDADSSKFSWAVGHASGSESLKLLHHESEMLSVLKNGNVTAFGDLASSSLTTPQLNVNALELTANTHVQKVCSYGMWSASTFGNAVLDAENDHCYIMSNIRLNFADAMAKCGKYGAHLVTINNDAEHTLAKPLLSTHQSAFIGLSDVGASNATGFRWVNGEVGPSDVMGRRSSETGSYYDTQVNNANRIRGSDHCVAMTAAGAWDLVNCDIPHYFMCEHHFHM